MQITTFVIRKEQRADRAHSTDTVLFFSPVASAARLSPQQKLSNFLSPIPDHQLDPINQ